MANPRLATFTNGIKKGIFKNELLRKIPLLVRK